MQAYVAGCLKAPMIDNSESCNVAVDTSSSAWKLVMTMPIDCDMWSADLATKLAALYLTDFGKYNDAHTCRSLNIMQRPIDSTRGDECVRP